MASPFFFGDAIVFGGVCKAAGPRIDRVGTAVPCPYNCASTEMHRLESPFIYH
jgi:hypothetical protein